MKSSRESFNQLTTCNLNHVRSALKEAMATTGQRQKSRSTVSHPASQIMGFLQWLIKQDGYKRLPADLPTYFQLPKSVSAKPMPKAEKTCASLEEAEALLEGM